MTRETKRIHIPLAVLAVLAVLTAVPSGARKSSPGTPGEAPASELSEAIEEQVQSEVDEELAERQKAIVEEAHAALDETHAALKALEADDKKEALAALARATGTLELLLARSPELAFAPVDVDIVTHDLYASVGAITAARKRAEELLEDGRVQEARALLSGLGSEIVISVTNLPLATYPDAIKAVAPLIDQGETEKAKTALRSVLNTLVVTKRVISLPVVRAAYMLEEAKELVNQEEPSEEDAAAIEKLLAGAREQLEMAEALGYGNEEAHKKFRSQITELEQKIGGGEATDNVFARLRKSLDGFQMSFSE